jgi:hypothetical protein
MIAKRDTTHIHYEPRCQSSAKQQAVTCQHQASRLQTAVVAASKPSPRARALSQAHRPSTRFACRVHLREQMPMQTAALSHSPVWLAVHQQALAVRQPSLQHCSSHCSTRSLLVSMRRFVLSAPATVPTVHPGQPTTGNTAPVFCTQRNTWQSHRHFLKLAHRNHMMTFEPKAISLIINAKYELARTLKCPFVSSMSAPLLSPFAPPANIYKLKDTSDCSSSSKNAVVSNHVELHDSGSAHTCFHHAPATERIACDDDPQ